MNEIVKDLLKIFISAWILGFILTLPRKSKLKKLQVHVPIWLQRVLFLIYAKDTIDIAGVIWQTVVYITVFVLLLAYRINVINKLQLVKRYFTLTVGSMFLGVFIIAIVEVILYQKKKGRYRNL